MPFSYNNFEAQSYKKVIGKTPHTVKMGKVNVNDLKLEPVDGNKRTGNPRLWTIHQGLLQSDKIQGAMSEEQQIEYFTETGEIYIRKSFEALREGIRTTGEADDEVHVRHDGTVIEGHRRTMVYKLLSKEDPRFSQIRVIVYPEGVSEQDIRIALGRIHVSGKAMWESSDRTKVCMELRDFHGMDEHAIAKYLGFKDVKSVKSYLLAGDLLEEYQKKTGDFSPDKFSYIYKAATITELYKTLKDPDYIGYDPKLWNNFCDWVHKGKLSDCRHVHDLTSKEVQLLKDERAIKILEEKGSQEAIRFVRRQSKFIAKSFEKIEEGIQELTAPTASKLREDALNEGVALQKRIKESIEALTALSRRLGDDPLIMRKPVDDILTNAVRLEEVEEPLGTL